MRLGVLVWTALLLVTGAGESLAQRRPTVSPDVRGLKRGDRPASSITAAAASRAEESYRLGPKDIVAIEVWNRVEVEYEKRRMAVEEDGTIYLPLLDEVNVSGMTVPDVTRKLTELYSDYIKKPQVFVVIEEYNSRNISVIGEVKEPGRLVLNGEMRLMDALAEAGDVTPGASAICRIMRRGPGGEEQILEVNLAELNSGDTSQNLLLQSGDTVIVLTSKDTVYVSGMVNHAGQYDFSEGMTAAQAIILAGGPAEGSASNRTKVYRLERGVMTEYKTNAKDLKESFYLKPGDIVHVPASYL